MGLIRMKHDLLMSSRFSDWWHSLRRSLLKGGLFIIIALAAVAPVATIVTFASSNDVAAASSKKRGGLKRIGAGALKAAAGAGAAAATAAGVDQACSLLGGGFGWFFCPVYSNLQTVANALIDQIASHLEWNLVSADDKINSQTVQPSANGGDPTNGGSINHLQNTWRQMANLANIAFVIAFVVMLYSIATSSGMSNYSVKKMLPRLIIMAVAMNLSFYICMGMVDISNIAGRAIYDLLAGSSDQVSVDLVGLLESTVATQAITLIIIVVGSMFAGTAALALAFIIVAIIFREVLLTVFLVISPLAFACALLPNTKRYFDKWFNNFAKALFVYPAFMAVWGGSQWCLSLIANSQLNNGDIMGSVVSGFTGYALMIAPVFTIKPLLTMSGGVMNMAAGKINNGLANKHIQGAASAINGAARQAVGGGIAKRFSRAAGSAARTVGASNGRVGSAAARALHSLSASTGKWSDKPDESAVENAAYGLRGMTNSQIQEIVATGAYTDNGKKKYVDSYTRRAAIKKFDDKLKTADKIGAVMSIHENYSGSGTAAVNARRELVDQIRGIPLVNDFVNNFENGKYNNLSTDELIEELYSTVANAAERLDANKQTKLDADGQMLIEDALKRLEAQGGEAAKRSTAIRSNLRSNAVEILENPTTGDRLSLSKRTTQLKWAGDANAIGLNEQQKKEVVLNGVYTDNNSKRVVASNYTRRSAFDSLDDKSLTSSEFAQGLKNILEMGSSEGGASRRRTSEVLARKAANSSHSMLTGQQLDDISRNVAEDKDRLPNESVGDSIDRQISRAVVDNATQKGGIAHDSKDKLDLLAKSLDNVRRNLDVNNQNSVDKYQRQFQAIHNNISNIINGSAAVQIMDSETLAAANQVKVMTAPQANQWTNTSNP